MDSFNKINSIPTGQEELKRKILEIKRHINTEWGEILENSWHIARTRYKGKKIKDVFKTYIKSKLIGEYPKSADFIDEELDALINSLDIEEDLPREKAVTTIAQTLAKSVSFEEIEESSVNFLKQIGAKELVRGLMYKIPGPEEAELHIPTTFFENLLMFNKNFDEGLRLLAKKVQTEAEFKTIKEISISSALVVKNPKFFIEKGFSLEKILEREPARSAVMSVQKLLELYDNNSK